MLPVFKCVSIFLNATQILILKKAECIDYLIEINSLSLAAFPN